MVMTDNTRAARLNASIMATGTHTTYSRASPLEIQQILRDPVRSENIVTEKFKGMADPIAPVISVTIENGVFTKESRIILELVCNSMMVETRL